MGGRHTPQRLQHRAPRTSVWPTVTLGELQGLAATVQEGSRAFFATLNEQALGEVVASTNTAGKSFENSIQDNLLLVAIHAQYHHGKVNRLKLPVAGTVEPVTFARMSLLFIAVALAASYLPARRASATDPMAVLRGK